MYHAKRDLKEDMSYNCKMIGYYMPILAVLC